jgi:uncharacterized protein
MVRLHLLLIFPMQSRLTDYETKMLREADGHFCSDPDINFPLVYPEAGVEISADPGKGLMALIQTGSDAYNLRTPTSDNDYTAIVMPSPKHIIGFGKWDHWEPGTEHDLDMKAMSLRKFFTLAAQGNPNAIELLFFRAEQYRWVSDQFTEILRWRDSFLSRAVFMRFSGYAHGQFQKMEGGKKEGYMGRKRFEMVQELGYDPKDASHLIRLLISGRSLVTRGVPRTYLEGEERDLVLGVKQGMLGLAEIKKLATAMADENERLFNHPQCPLRAHPDMPIIETMLMLMHREACR